MSRTQSQGIEYFPFAVDFFADNKVKILKARYGADGIMIYMYILCCIYREGYYTKVNDDFIFIISDDLHISSETVQQVMTFLLKRSMFNEQLFKSDAILTSDGIQERWQIAVAKRAQKTPIKVSDYWLLEEADTKPYIKVAHFSDSSAKNTFTSAKKALNSANYPQSKVKESKVEEGKTAVADFYEQNIGILSRTISSDIDFYLSNGFEPELIIACIKKSVDNNKRTWGYAKAIINSLSNQGIKTVKDWNAKDKFSKKQVNQSHSYNMDEFDKLGYDIPEV